MKAIALTLGMMLIATTWSTPAAAPDLTLDDVPSVGNPLVTSVETNGFRFSGPALRTIDTPGSTYVSNGSAVYLAQTVARRRDHAPADRRPAVRPVRVRGDRAVRGRTRLSHNSTHVSLLAIQGGGVGLSAIYDLAASTGFVHFPVPASWNNLEFVTFSGVFWPPRPGRWPWTTSAWARALPCRSPPPSCWR